jgi:hypothetical protein
MNLKPITMAVGSALAVLSASAFAITPEAYNAIAAANKTEVYVSGSSALDPALLRILANQCKVSTIDEYVGSNEYAVFCQTPTAGKYFGFYKESTNGSANGVLAIDGAGKTRPFISPTGMITALGASTTACPVTSTIVVGGGSSLVNSVVIHNCAGISATAGAYIQDVLPDLGLSDVEPPIFVPGGVTTATVTPIAAQIFGVPVSKNIYALLQAKEGLGTGADEANMPSLSSEVVNGIYVGAITNWSQLGVATGSTLVDDNIYIARRTDQTLGGIVSSGTQTSTEIYYTTEICNPNVALKFLPASTVDGANVMADCTTSSITASFNYNSPKGQPFAVFAGTSGGKVQGCLTQLGKQNQGGIGLLGGTDQPSTAGSNNGFAFVKINGYSPSIYNVAKGYYNDWFEASAQLPSHNGQGGAAGATEAGTIVSEFNDVVPIGDVDGAIVTSWGSPSGLLVNGYNFASGAVTGTALPASFTAANVLANPINPFARNVTGIGQSCNPATPANAPVAIAPPNPNTP